jgi:dienelactone hydrolase
VGSYEIVAFLGAGGMGQVYKAHDTRLGRFVALKILPEDKLSQHPDQLKRFIREARAASALNHPNIITIHDVGFHDDVPFIAMEYVRGESLQQRIAAQGALPLDGVLDYALQISAGLADAHAAGIVHRDIKPANIMISDAPDGSVHVKVLDFGVAKLAEAPLLEDASTLSAGALTGSGTAIGTVAYMSPEQALGKPLDARSDVFSFGVVLYEMLTGRRPFTGESHVSTLLAIAQQQPPPLEESGRAIAPELKRLVMRCLEKDPSSRHDSATEVHKELIAYQSHSHAPGQWSRAWRPRYLVPLFVLLIAGVVAGWRSYVNFARTQWAKEDAVPSIRRLIEERRFEEAYRMAEEAERYGPNESTLEQVWPKISRRISVKTTPSGANVYVKPYATPAAAWVKIGESPLEAARLPLQPFRFRIEKSGFETVEASDGVPYLSHAASEPLHFHLAAVGSIPSEMVRVPAGQVRMFTFGFSRSMDLREYLIDRFEVTNKNFARFIAEGGYANRKFWKREFFENGRQVRWEHAIARFIDATGRPGPSTWVLGAFKDESGNFPVTGISWYEAAAYCESQGKSLPTVFHWYRASGIFAQDRIIPLSNIGGLKAAAPIGSFAALGPYGTYDMAGNAKEWCSNETGNKRFILGGAWDEPTYMFGEPDARSPFDRSHNNGFRCAVYDAPPLEDVAGAIPRATRDYSVEQPISDEVMQVYRNLFSYDRTPLNSIIESTDNTHEHWIMEKITFDAAYGHERVSAFLFRPKSAQPPYQTVVYFPGGGAENIASSSNLTGLEHVEVLVRSGRAVMYPIYQGTYEREARTGDRQPASVNLDAPVLAGRSAYRDKVVMMAKDLFRSIDYLAGRADIRADRLAYVGHSLGARLGVIFLSLESRFRAAVLFDGGLHMLPKPLRAEEVDEFQFARHVRTPVIMVNGRHDFTFPFDKSQAVLFRELGAPNRDKRHVLSGRGHSVPIVSNEEVREVLNWLDRYLGEAN